MEFRNKGKWLKQIQESKRILESGGTFAELNGEDLTGTTFNGDLSVNRKDLTSLKGMPKVVKGKVDLGGTLDNLEGAPEIITGFFDCLQCDLKSLKGMPKQVGGFSVYTLKGETNLRNLSNTKINGNLHISHTGLTSLKGLETQKNLHHVGLYSNNSLKNLEGSPKSVTGDFNVDYCSNLTSLKGAPEKVGGDFTCRGCNLKSLEGLPKVIGGTFDCRDNPELKSIDLVNLSKIGRVLADVPVIGAKEKQEAVISMFKQKPSFANKKEGSVRKHSGVGNGNYDKQMQVDIIYNKPKELSNDDIQDLHKILTFTNSSEGKRLLDTKISLPTNGDFELASITVDRLLKNFKPVISGSKVTFKNVTYVASFVYD